MRTIRITCVAGARPNFVKVAAILDAMSDRKHVEAKLIHTGQHYSQNMSDSFFADLGIPTPDCNLGAGGSTPTQQTAEIMQRIEPVLLEYRPDFLVVVGDVNSTLAAALVAAKLGIRIVHVESGLRSFDRSMPEEINRVLTDAISDYLFVSEPSGEENLVREGIDRKRIFFCGNVMIDTLLRFRDRAMASPVLQQLGLESRGYAVLTLHRPSNVDDPARLEALLTVLNLVGERIRIVFPVHPRTAARIDTLNPKFPHILLTPPQNYLDFLRLMNDARMMLTDSGGIQEETTILQVPCLTIRNNTERPITISRGTNRLVGTDPPAILNAAVETLTTPMPSGRVPEMWDGKAAKRIVDVLERLADTLHGGLSP